MIYYGGKIQAMGTLKELLATPDAVAHHDAGRCRVKRWSACWRSSARTSPTDKVRIDTPTQNLESYFLDVVQKARQAGPETSGAMSGARVAAYLRGDAEQKPEGDRLLERLSNGAAKAGSSRACRQTSTSCRRA